MLQHILFDQTQLTKWTKSCSAGLLSSSSTSLPTVPANASSGDFYIEKLYCATLILIPMKLYLQLFHSLITNQGTSE